MSQLGLFSFFFRIWVYEFHPKFFYYIFFITTIFQQIFLLLILFPFLFFTSNFVHHKTPWPLRPHSGQYPPGSLGPFSSPGSPSAVHDQVCSLKRSAVCSAPPALVNDMTGSIILYCVLHTCDLVCELFWYINKQYDKVINISNLNLKTNGFTLYLLCLLFLLPLFVWF